MRYGKETSIKVFKKYNYRCAKCGSKKDLTFHHLDRNGRNNENNKLPVNNNLNNLMLICRKCHGSIHGKQHGKKYD